MRSRSTAERVGQPLEPARGARAGSARRRAAARRRSRRRSRGRRAGRAAARRRARAGCERRGARAARAARCDVARGVEDRATCGDDLARVARRSCAGDVVAQPREAGLVPGRAAGLGDQRVERRGRARPRARRATLPCGARASASCAVRCQAGPGTWRSGDGDVEQQQPARAGAHRRALRGRRLEHAHADRRRPRRPAPGSARTACAGARQRDRRAAASPIVQRVSPCARARARRRASSRAQPRRDLLAQRVEVLALGDDARRARPRPGSVIRRCGGSRPRSHASRGIAHAAQRLELALERVEQRLAARAAARASTARGDVGHRDERPAQLLGQRADQRGDELLAQPGHEPVEAVGAQLRRARVSGTWTVTPSCARARLEAVGQRQRRARPGATPSGRRARGRARRRASSTSSSRVKVSRSGSRAARVASTSGRSARRRRRRPGSARRRSRTASRRRRGCRAGGRGPRAPRPRSSSCAVVGEEARGASSQSPSTSAWRMNSSRDELRVDPAVVRPCGRRRSAGRTASPARSRRPTPRLRSQCGSL